MALKKTSWESSPYDRCAFNTEITHLLESLTFCGRFLERLTLTCFLASAVQFYSWDSSPLTELATPPGTSHLSPTWRYARWNASPFVEARRLLEHLTFVQGD